MWESLAQLRRGRLSAPSAVQALEDYRALAGDLAAARQAMPGSPLTSALERLYASLHAVVTRVPYRPGAALVQLYAVQIPQTIRALQRHILWVALLFCLSTAAGWWLIHTFPTLIGLVASQDMIRHVQRGELWTRGILNVVPSPVLSLRILSNNIAVTCFAFCAGIFYGLGTFYIIAVNGLMLGAAFAFTRQYGLDGELLRFITAHGTVELSVICLSGAAGAALGESLFRPALGRRRDSLQQCAASMLRLFAAFVPLLVICGFIEGYVSPDPAAGWPVRILIGAANFLLMLAVLSGRPFRSGAGA